MKLVRDGIPAKVASQGETEPFRQAASKAEYDKLLDAKLDEELAEWRESEELDELADLMAVIRDIAVNRGSTWIDLLEREARKRDLYGGYRDGVVWLGGA